MLFSHPRQIGVNGSKPIVRHPRLDEYPFLAIKNLQVAVIRDRHCPYGDAADLRDCLSSIVV